MKYITIDKNTHRITAKATSSALTNSDFYGLQNEGTTYTMIITTRVKEGFDFENEKDYNGNSYNTEREKLGKRPMVKV